MSICIGAILRRGYNHSIASSPRDLCNAFCPQRLRLVYTPTLRHLGDSHDCCCYSRTCRGSDAVSLAAVVAIPVHAEAAMRFRSQLAATSCNRLQFSIANQPARKSETRAGSGVVGTHPPRGTTPPPSVMFNRGWLCTRREGGQDWLTANLAASRRVPGNADLWRHRHSLQPCSGDSHDCFMNERVSATTFSHFQSRVAVHCGDLAIACKRVRATATTVVAIPVHAEADERRVGPQQGKISMNERVSATAFSNVQSRVAVPCGDLAIACKRVRATATTVVAIPVHAEADERRVGPQQGKVSMNERVSATAFSNVQSREMSVLLRCVFARSTCVVCPALHTHCPLLKSTRPRQPSLEWTWCRCGGGVACAESSCLANYFWHSRLPCNLLGKR